MKTFSRRCIFFTLKYTPKSIADPVMLWYLMLSNRDSVLLKALFWESLSKRLTTGQKLSIGTELIRLSVSRNNLESFLHQNDN